MTFNFDVLFWCVPAIVLNIVIFKSLSHFGRKSMEEIYEDMETELKEAQYHQFEIKWWKLKIANVTVWVCLIAPLVLFHGLKWTESPTDMGYEAAEKEAAEYVEPDSSEIDKANADALREKEIARDKEIKMYQEESDKAYDAFIKEQLDNLSKKGAEHSEPGPSEIDKADADAPREKEIGRDKEINMYQDSPDKAYDAFIQEQLDNLSKEENTE